jgi:hypothetical protein
MSNACNMYIFQLFMKKNNFGYNFPIENNTQKYHL